MDEINIDVPKGKYVLAVSGGVDSAVLLDLLNRQPELTLIVAHFDHGIRPESAEDRKFVGRLAEKYGYGFEYAEGRLGPGVSEETARNARYEFLEAIMNKHDAKGIITAHHEDDVLETAIMNLIRGTYRKGLSALGSKENIVRPLLKTSRTQIESYAGDRKLEWREDPSNKDPRYLRNYVRLSVIPALNRQDSNWRARMLNKIEKSANINLEVNSAIDKLADANLFFAEDQITIPRNWLIMLPNAVGMEVMKHAIQRLNAAVEIDKQLLKTSLLFGKTAKPGKKRPLGKNAFISVGRKDIRLQRKSPA